MKSLIPIVVLTSVAGIAAFGFLAMSHNSGDHRTCLASLANGFACPENINSFAELSFHTSAFQKLSTAVLNSSYSVMLTLLLTIFLAWFSVIFNSGGKISFLSKNLEIAKLSEEVRFISRASFLNWLSFHENSPSFA